MSQMTRLDLLKSPCRMILPSLREQLHDTFMWRRPEYVTVGSSAVVLMSEGVAQLREAEKN